MLYISIIFVLTGVLILIYSLSVESRKMTAEDAEKAGSPGETQRGDGGGHSEDSGGGYDIHDIYNVSGGLMEPAGSKGSAGTAGVTDHAPPDDQAGGGSGESDEEVSARTEAILYEDASDIINYSSETGTIDPTLEEYKKIERVGKGELLFEKNGISFYTADRLYRFDFHRFEDLKTGNNYMALLLKGGGNTKLFIFTGNYEIIDTIRESYSDYIGS